MDAVIRTGIIHVTYVKYKSGDILIAHHKKYGPSHFMTGSILKRSGLRLGVMETTAQDANVIDAIEGGGIGYGSTAHAATNVG